MLNCIDKNRYRIGITMVSITNIEKSINLIEETVNKGLNAQVCVLDFSAVCYANSHNDYNDIINKSLINNPDGIPLVWLARLWGLKTVKQTMGPELFIRMLNKQKNGIKHFLLGDTEEVLQQIIKTFAFEKGALIVGAYSPPFINLNDYNYLSIAKLINESDANIVWVSMTSPKQDYFGENILPLLNNKIIIGVGAAFRYSIGKYKLPQGISKRIGLGGFMRKANFLDDIIWYLKHSILLLSFSINIIYRKLIGKNYFE